MPSSSYPARAVVAALVAAFLTSACDDGGGGTGGPTTPEPGTVTYRLTSPNGAEGAVRFSVPVVEASAARPVEGTGHTVLAREQDGVLHVVVVNPRGGPLAVLLDVADRASPPAPAIVEVAGPDNRLRSLAGYALEVEP